MDDWKRLESLLQGLIAEVSKPLMPPRAKSLLPAITALDTDFRAQMAAANNAELFRLQAAIRNMWQEVEQATGTGPKRSFKDRVLEQFSVGAIFGVIILVVAFGGVAWLLVAYIGHASLDALSTIEGTRPLLTVASIIATFAFGGGLVFAALFSNEGGFENRFRMAREIFLVFSGVFATVVGFHFGSPSSADSAARAEREAAAALIGEPTIQEKDGKLVLTIKGGTPPYKVEADFDGIKKSVEGASPLSLSLEGLDTSKPVGKLSFRITDKKNASREVTAGNLALQGFISPRGESGGPVPAPKAGK